jgi:hypothetical protein
MFKEDSVQIPTHKSWIIYFHPDSPVKRPDAHQSATLSGRCGMTVRTPISVKKRQTVPGFICPDIMATRPDAL